MLLKLFNICAFILFIPIYPFVGLFFLTLLSYGALAKRLIRLYYGATFKGFLEGLDAIWNVETGSSRSMLNLLFFVESPLEGHSDIPERFLRDIRKTILEKLKDTPRQPYPRIFWTRRQRFGYCFWTDDSKLTIEDYVRFMEPIGKDCGGGGSERKFLDEAQLHEFAGKVSNRHLPNGHAACWELLIGTEPVRQGKSDTAATVKYPMMLRLHHTAGDGMAIVKLILDTITGNHAALAARICTPAKPAEEPKKCGGLKLTQLLKLGLNGPAIVLRMIFRKSEKSYLSTTKVTDYKVANWHHEPPVDVPEQAVISIVKRTKQLVEGGRFSDVFLLALASSFQKFFDAKGEPAPEQGISVIVPGRAGSEAKSLKIKNRFTTRHQQLKIGRGVQLDSPDKLSKLRQQLSIIAQGSTCTRSNASHTVTSWFISTLTGMLPVPMLRLVVHSFRVNVVFSILPEIEQVSFQGLRMVDPVLLLPNTGNISICLAVLTFGNKVHVGILADRTIVSSEEEAHLIVEEVVAEIQRMGKVLDEEQKMTSISFENE
ncbi:hypothetical protein pipiens_012581 [Culex pipiens pipiens]|uniref:O-acyltransferase WSD1 C-terminal domain-containing protein n=1 Tax=Culex pipiens pipiens TaxID=38569 RepID=A0ABD1D1T8_CULPP